MCQVCHHEPLDKSLCEPNKTLRMTVKAVLKKKLVERATQRKREEAAKNEAARAEAQAQSQPAGHENANAAEGRQSTYVEETTSTARASSENDDASRGPVNSNPNIDGNASLEGFKEAQDIPQPSIEVQLSRLDTCEQSH